MSGWLDWLVGGAQRPASLQQPPSTGALLGMNYQGLPNSPNIDDQRRNPFDYPYSMRQAAGYQFAFDPTESVAPLVVGGDDTGVYSSSFGQNFRPRAQTPYQTSPTGPNLPPRPLVHLPISPGDPGWTSPPSPSGPHNRQGDPARPGYDPSAIPLDAVRRGLTLNSLPWWAAS